MGTKRKSNIGSGNRAWDEAVAHSFVREVERTIYQTVEECEVDSPYEVLDEVGRALLDLFDTTYGLKLYGTK